MFTVEIELTDDEKKFIDEQVKEGGFGSPDEYIQSLLLADQKRKAEDHLAQLLNEGLNSPRTEVTPEFWTSIRQEVEERITRQQAEKTSNGPR